MDYQNKELAIFQTPDGALKLKTDMTHQTIWASLDQISQLFGRDKSVISRHIKNIFKEDELNENSVVAKNATTAIDGKTYQVTFYNLDMILSVGYRVNSKIATKFRQWATQTLKHHIQKGFTIDQKRLEENKAQFLKTLQNLKILTNQSSKIETKDVIELIEYFSDTFFDLNQYDKKNFPKNDTEEEIKASESMLYKDLNKLKQNLLEKGEATKLFAQEKNKGNLKGILHSVFQTVFGKDAYPSVDEKAAHLLYFIIKNHPFNDGNKRSAAFSFVWFLQKVNHKHQSKITPATLTTLTLLIAESKPSDKEKMIGIILLLLNKN